MSDKKSTSAEQTRALEIRAKLPEETETSTTTIEGMAPTTEKAVEEEIKEETKEDTSEDAAKEAKEETKEDTEEDIKEVMKDIKEQTSKENEQEIKKEAGKVKEETKDEVFVEAQEETAKAHNVNNKDLAKYDFSAVKDFGFDHPMSLEKLVKHVPVSKLSEIQSLNFDFHTIRDNEQIP